MLGFSRGFGHSIRWICTFRLIKTKLQNNPYDGQSSIYEAYVWAQICTHTHTCTHSYFHFDNIHVTHPCVPSFPAQRPVMKRKREHEEILQSSSATEIQTIWHSVKNMVRENSTQERSLSTKGCGVVPCSWHWIKLVQCSLTFASSSVCLSVCFVDCMPTVILLRTWSPRTCCSLSELHWVLTLAGCNDSLPCHSSLVEFSSREDMVLRLWEAVIVATVWSRTRTSRHSLSLLLHSLEFADELKDVPCWHDGWVLLKVPLDLLSDLLSHRTSQHSASTSEGLSSRSPERQSNIITQDAPTVGNTWVPTFIKKSKIFFYKLHFPHKTL